MIIIVNWKNWRIDMDLKVEGLKSKHGLKIDIDRI